MAHLIKDIIPVERDEVDFAYVHRFVPAIAKRVGEKGVSFELLPSPRIMRSHSLYIKRIPRAVYLMRDGRDVLVSYYMHFRKNCGFKDTFYDFLCSDVRKIEWHEHVKSWIYANTSLSNICLVRYEDMLLAPLKEVTKIVRFIGFQRTSRQIQNAIDHSSFESMSQLEQTKGLGLEDAGNGEIPFVRKGKPGEWKKFFGKKEKAFIKQLYGNSLIRTGYESHFQW